MSGSYLCKSHSSPMVLWSMKLMLPFHAKLTLNLEIQNINVTDLILMD